MAIPIQRQLISSFRGLQESGNLVTMADVFSSSGSKNVWMDEHARVRKVLGYAKQNSSAVTTNTGGSATKVVGLAPYRSTSGVTVTRSLVGVFDDGTNEWEIWTSTDDGANWTFRADIGASAVGRIPSFAQFGSDLFICTGVGTPRTWNNTTVGTAGGTQSPTPTVAAGAAGNLSGTYQYKLVSVEADGSRHPGSAASTAKQLNATKASLSWTADADGDVVGYEVYRTTATGLVFRFIDYVDGRLTVAYTDNTTDEDQRIGRALQEHGDAPPNAHFCAPHQQRMWWGRTDANPLRAWYSDPNDPDSVWVDYSYVDFVDEVTLGDQITGMVGGYQAMLVAFTERSIWTVSGTGQSVGEFDDWSVDRTAASIGAVSGASIVTIPAGAVYYDQFGEMKSTSTSTLAYFSPYGDIRLFNGSDDEIVSHAVKETLDAFAYGQRARFFALHDPLRKQVTWYFADGSNTYNNIGVTWNYRYGCWYAVTPVSFGCGVTIDTSSDESVLLVGEAQTSAGGYVYKNWSGNSFNGTAIAARYMTKPLLGSDDNGTHLLHATKRWRDCDVLLLDAVTAEVSVEWLQGFADDDATADGSNVISATSGPLVTSDGNYIYTSDANLVYVTADSFQVRFPLQKSDGAYPISEALRLRITDNSTNADWALEGLVLGYQVLTGVRDLRT